MDFNFDDDDAIEDFEQQIHEHSLYHANQILQSNQDAVNLFINQSTAMLLNKIDKVEDDTLALELTQLVGTLIGGMGQAIIDLKKENIQLKTDFITDQIKKQNPDLN